MGPARVLAHSLSRDDFHIEPPKKDEEDGPVRHLFSGKHRE